MNAKIVSKRLALPLCIATFIFILSTKTTNHFDYINKKNYQDSQRSITCLTKSKR